MSSDESSRRPTRMSQVFERTFRGSVYLEPLLLRSRMIERRGLISARLLLGAAAFRPAARPALGALKLRGMGMIAAVFYVSPIFELEDTCTERFFISPHPVHLSSPCSLRSMPLRWLVLPLFFPSFNVLRCAALRRRETNMGCNLQRTVGPSVTSSGLQNGERTWNVAAPQKNIGALQYGQIRGAAKPLVASLSRKARNETRSSQCSRRMRRACRSGGVEFLGRSLTTSALPIGRIDSGYSPPPP